MSILTKFLGWLNPWNNQVTASLSQNNQQSSVFAEQSDFIKNLLKTGAVCFKSTADNRTVVGNILQVNGQWIFISFDGIKYKVFKDKQYNLADPSDNLSEKIQQYLRSKKAKAIDFQLLSAHYGKQLQEINDIISSLTQQGKLTQSKQGDITLTIDEQAYEFRGKYKEYELKLFLQRQYLAESVATPAWKKIVTYPLLMLASMANLQMTPGATAFSMAIAASSLPSAGAAFSCDSIQTAINAAAFSQQCTLRSSTNATEMTDASTNIAAIFKARVVPIANCADLTEGNPDCTGLSEALTACNVSEPQRSNFLMNLANNGGVATCVPLFNEFMQTGIPYATQLNALTNAKVAQLNTETSQNTTVLNSELKETKLTLQDTVTALKKSQEENEALRNLFTNMQLTMNNQLASLQQQINAATQQAQTAADNAESSQTATNVTAVIGILLLILFFKEIKDAIVDFFASIWLLIKQESPIKAKVQQLDKKLIAIEHQLSTLEEKIIHEHGNEDIQFNLGDYQHINYLLTEIGNFSGFLKNNIKGHFEQFKDMIFAEKNKNMHKNSVRSELAKELINIYKDMFERLEEILIAYSNILKAPSKENFKRNVKKMACLIVHKKYDTNQAKGDFNSLQKEIVLDQYFKILQTITGEYSTANKALLDLVNSHSTYGSSKLIHTKVEDNAPREHQAAFDNLVKSIDKLEEHLKRISAAEEEKRKQEQADVVVIDVSLGDQGPSPNGSIDSTGSTNSGKSTETVHTPPFEESSKKPQSNARFFHTHTRKMNVQEIAIPEKNEGDFKLDSMSGANSQNKSGVDYYAKDSGLPFDPKQGKTDKVTTGVPRVVSYPSALSLLNNDDNNAYSRLVPLSRQSSNIAAELSSRKPPHQSVVNLADAFRSASQRRIRQSQNQDDARKTLRK